MTTKKARQMERLDVLDHVNLLSDLTIEQRRQFTQHLHPEHLRAGDLLYQSGDPAECVYLIAYGRLRMSKTGEDNCYFGRYDMVGEAEILTDCDRLSEVYALRDTQLYRISKSDFLHFIKQHACMALALSRLIVQRQQLSSIEHHCLSKGRTMSIVPVSNHVPAIHLAEALATHLEGWPQVRLITDVHVDALFGEGFSQTPMDYSADDLKLRQWLSSLEDKHRYVLYAANRGDDQWALRCLHQADRILILAEANSYPDNLPLAKALNHHPWQSPIELVLLRNAGDASPYTLLWKRAVNARAHYFVHPWANADIKALARQISSKGLGLVLGGGGARGFAHIGLIRALEQLHIPIDIVGGTSMGAFIAALVACGFDSVEMARIASETFVTRNYLNDYTMPRVSLIRGQRFHSRLKSIFGDRKIEELRQTFYCISTNLTTGQPVVHDQGDLATWVGTSMCVPGVAPPVAWHENLLCDGGVINNLPTDVMQNLERGTIIASNVSLHGDIRAPGIGLEEPDQSALLNWDKIIKNKLLHAPRLAEILMRTATLASETLVQQASIDRANLHIRMPIEGIGMFDWVKLDELIDRGYEHALEVLLPIRETLSN